MVGKDADHVGDGGERRGIRERLREERMSRRFLGIVVFVMVLEERRQVVQHVSPEQR